MAWSFGDGFDLYAAIADMVTGYWDSGSPSGNFQTGRFAGSRAYNPSSGQSTPYLVKASGVNDSVHHFCVAFYSQTAISGSSTGIFIQVRDGATAQCTIFFRSDGAIILASGTQTGTVLATYSGAFTAVNTWYQFECEVVIHNTTGSFTVRKNGNSVADFTLGSLNTRGGTANNYANAAGIGQATSVANFVDDFFWRSDASSIAWMGDIRCFTRMPASDASVQFSRTPTSFLAQSSAVTGPGAALSANNIRATAVAAPTTGTLASLVFNLVSGITGHMKMALYDNSGASGGPGALLASGAELTNPAAGINTFTVAGGPTVQRGATYWVAFWADVSVTGSSNSNFATDILAMTYTTSFPATMAGFSVAGTIAGVASAGMNVTPINAGVVNEAQQDALTSYVYDSTPGHADLYNLAAIGSTPASVIAVTTRAYMQKSDAGTRTAAVNLKSGAATVASPTVTLTTSGWLWAWRTDITDPATGAAWTAVAVNNAQIGPVTIA